MAETIYGTLVLDGYSGRTETKVEIVGQTRKRLRIRALFRTKLAGRSRWLEKGETALVPPYAVRDNCMNCGGKRGGIPGNENVIGKAVLCDYCSVERANV